MCQSVQIVFFFAIFIAIGYASQVDIVKDYGFISRSKWCNELGSYMIIDEVDPVKGTFNGQYNSKVGEATWEYLLMGRFGAGRTLGWTVSWKNEQTPNGTSSTSWSGQFQLCKVGATGSQVTPTILTTWLLTSQTQPDDNWQSTLTSKDTFHLVPQGRECSVNQPCFFYIEKAIHDEM